MRKKHLSVICQMPHWRLQVGDCVRAPQAPPPFPFALGMTPAPGKVDPGSWASLTTKQIWQLRDIRRDRTVSYALRPLLGNDAGGIQLGGSGDTADD